MNESQLHAGHRERMIERFLTYPDSLNDHEILEILLYNLVPRIDTNPLAHRLIRMFGSLEGVFNASKEELLTVQGVGIKVVTGLLVIANVFRRIKSQKTEQVKEVWGNPTLIEKYLRNIITDYTTETSVMVLLDGKCNKLFHLFFEDKDKYSVTMDVPEVYTAFAIYKPKFALVAHTHPSGVAQASLQDDFTTHKLNILCSIHGVSLADHLILTKDDIFSYRFNGKMESVREISDLSRLLNQIKENENE